MSANPFWEFSLAVYGRPGVPAACVALQDRHGLDVNVLLFAAWAGVACGVALSAERLAAVDSAIAAWRQEVVRPLRAVRRRVKAEDDALYQRMKAVELEAERIQQDRLFALGGLTPQPGGDARVALANMTLLLPGGDPLLDVLAAALAG
jgi:uncharacterized protein (TIGR02444 family)